MKRTLIIVFAVFFAILAFSIVTTPSDTKHKEFIVDKFTEAMDQEFEKTGSNSERAFYELGKTSAITVLNNSIRTENYLIFSIAELKMGGKQKNVTFGIMGFIIPTVDFDKLKKQ